MTKKKNEVEETLIIGNDDVPFTQETEVVFDADSDGYDIFERIGLIKGLPGAIVEIGTRLGGSAQKIIDTLARNNDTDRLMLCIDPYGNIPIPVTYNNFSKTDINVFRQIAESLNIKEDEYDSLEKCLDCKLDYTNEMKKKVTPSLYEYAYSKGINFHFLHLTDDDFFAAFPNGFPVYNEFRRLENSYAFVFFDGPHDNFGVIREVCFFIPRTPIGGVYVFDDIWMYEHTQKIESILFAHGFKVLGQSGPKAAYQKVK